MKSYGGDELVNQVALLSKKLPTSDLQVCFLAFDGWGM